MSGGFVISGHSKIATKHCLARTIPNLSIYDMQHKDSSMQLLFLFSNLETNRSDDPNRPSKKGSKKTGRSEVLLAWYSLIQHLLLDDSTPDDESTYDVITRLRRSEEGCLDLRDVESLISPNTQPAF